MLIEQVLIDNFDKKIIKYFPSPQWESNFRKSMVNIDHDEPWLTLIACYAMFGNQSLIRSNQYQAINEILNKSNIKKAFKFDSISKIGVEEKLPEILVYRQYLKDLFKKDNFHLYPDIRESIDSKIVSKNASLEGNTNVDLIIEGESEGRKTVLFIESKYLSDISYQTKYNPARDQIIRNIDCGIDYVLNKENGVDFSDFFFMLLTPKVFRPKEFGGGKVSKINQFGADTSRLYSYKMIEYTDPAYLKLHLPHRQLDDTIWQIIANNIGWITFEDFWSASLNNSTINDVKEQKLIEDFFVARNLV